VEKLIDVVENRQTFNALFYSVIWGNPSDLEYAKLRFTESLNCINLSKAHISSKTNSKGWLWPKGRLASNFELPFHCALREFNEETGVMIGADQSLVSSTPLIESFRGNNGRTYETHCWIYIFPEETALPDIEDLQSPGEIGERKWVSEEEAKILLRESKFLMLQDAKKTIEQKVVLGSF
jgi:8-oxo-dGTP pyrophosphatase MutT (NUDIX family)